MGEYILSIAEQLGIPVWLTIVIFLWSVIWKLLALWKSARKKHIAWFIILAIVNTVGILEILYIYIFSEMNLKKNKSKKTKTEKSPKKPTKKKASKKKK